MKLLITSLIYIVTFVPALGQAQNILDNIGSCDKLHITFEKRSTHSIVKTTSPEGVEEYIVKSLSDISKVSEKLWLDLAKFCPEEDFQLSHVYTCIKNTDQNTGFELGPLIQDFSHIVSINNPLCENELSHKSQFKFNLYTLFAGKEFSLISNALKECESLTLPEAIESYSVYKLKKQCIEPAMGEVAKLIEPYRSMSTFKFSRKFKGFKKKLIKLSILENFESRLKMLGQSRESSLFQDFKKIIDNIFSYDRKKLYINNKKIKTLNFFEKLSGKNLISYIDHFILERLSESNLQNKYEDHSGFLRPIKKDHLNQFKECVQAGTAYIGQVNIVDDPAGQMNILDDFYELAEKKCGNCSNSCETNSGLQFNQCFSNLITKGNLIDDSFLDDPITKDKYRQQYQACISKLAIPDIEDIKICHKNATYSQRIEAVERVIKNEVEKTNLTSSSRYRVQAVDCISSNNDLEICKKNIEDNIYYDHISKLIDGKVPADIMVEFKNCTMNPSGKKCDLLLLKSLSTNYQENIMERQTPLANLELKFKELLSKVDKYQAFEVAIMGVALPRRVEYETNTKSYYCTRKLDYASTIIFHHTATSKQDDEVDINDIHIGNQTSNDWYMIAYHYLIREPNNDGKIDLVQGRELDYIGAHAGTVATIDIEPADLRKLQSDKLKCHNGEGVKHEEVSPNWNGKTKANHTSVGVAFVGNFVKGTVLNAKKEKVNGDNYPSDAMLKHAAKLSCSLQKMYPSLKKFGYHSQFNNTACPGLVRERINIIKKYAKELGCDFQ